MKFLEWLLITIQYTLKLKSLRKGVKVYAIMKEEQKRRREDNEPPFEGTWVFKLQRIWWGLKHTRLTGISAREVVLAYDSLVRRLTLLSEENRTEQFCYGGEKLRLSGSTVVINEKWAINIGLSGVYVHKKDKPDGDWELVYRTNWLMKDVGFVSPLLRALDFTPKPKEHSFNLAVSTDIN